MKLVGMLDSPYVRRVAISLQLLGLRFEHQSLSVFRGFEAFRAINPVVKAPTLICDDGSTLIDSSLILDYAEALARPRSLMPSEISALQRELRLIGLGLAACEKSVQIVYERDLRPEDKQFAPWRERVTGQMHAAYDLIEAELASSPLPSGSALSQAGVTLAVAWHFSRSLLHGVLNEEAYPLLNRFSEEAESLPAFMAAPHGDGVVQGLA